MALEGTGGGDESDEVFAVCTGFPHVAPVVGSSSPTVEEYRLFRTDGEELMREGLYF